MKIDLAIAEIQRGNSIWNPAMATTAYLKSIGGLLKQFTGASGFPGQVGGTAAPYALTDTDLTRSDWVMI